MAAYVLVFPRDIARFAADDPTELWRRSQTGVAPLKRKK